MYNLRGFGVHPKVKFRRFFFAYYFLGCLNAVFRGFISQRPASCLRLSHGCASPPVEFLLFFACDDFSGAFLIDLWMTARGDG